jgi:hypothetical protein
MQTLNKLIERINNSNRIEERSDRIYFDNRFKLETVDKASKLNLYIDSVLVHTFHDIVEQKTILNAVQARLATIKKQLLKEL